MADENARKQDQDNTKDKGKAMGAGASGSHQGQQGQQGPNVERKPNETAGQGGGVQGTGQHQANPGGYTGGQGNLRDEDKRGGASSTPGRKDQDAE